MPSPPPPPRSPAERLEFLIERTERLHRLTAHLSTALQAEYVAEIVVEEGTDALRAHSGALWRVDEEAQRLVLLRAKHYPPDALERVRSLPLDPATPIADAVLRNTPVWLSSRADYAQRYASSAERTRSMSAPTEYAVAALPIILDGRPRGVLALTFQDARGFDEDERTYLSFLALHCGQGFERARLYESVNTARRAAEAAHERAVFLSKASELLGSSLDYEQTLRNVASLAVPKIGDWCGVELIETDGTIHQVAVAHVDPAKVEFARQLRHRYPPDPNAPNGVPYVLRTGSSELYPVISDEMLSASAVDDEHLRILRELGLHSAMSVPIKNRVDVLGAISFVSAHSDRVYTNEDLLMAQQLGERAGAAISNARLYSEAREAIRIRDEFMLVAGHELRTPLATLSLHHEALTGARDGTPLEKIRERGTKLRAQTERLARLVEDLLDVSRISAGRLSLELEDLELGTVVREVAERLRDELERSKTPLTLELDEVRGRWDKPRIDQIVTNLLTNAAKYGKGAPIAVSVRRTGDAATIVVSDAGIGIPVEDHARIFQRFERAVSARKFGGLGLGLWIAMQLAEAHGGTITVASAPGSGATFTVTLPLSIP